MIPAKAIFKRQKVREKVKVDPKIVSSRYQHGGNAVLYHTLKKDEEMATKRLINGACFSSLLGMFRSDKDHTHVCYKMEEDSNQEVKLTKEEKYCWIDLCIKYGTMPDYITKENIDKKLMTINSKDVSPSLLFVYLCCFRYFREDPGFIRAVLYLVNGCEMNYYAAFVLASRVCLNYDLHHILTIVRKYSENVDLDTTTIPLHIIIGLRRFIADPGRYDKRTIYDAKSGSYGYNEFECAKRIEAISPIRYDCSIQDLFDSYIEKAITAKSDEEVKKMLDKFLSYKDKIVCREEK